MDEVYNQFGKLTHLSRPPVRISWYCRIQGDCTEVFRTQSYTTIPSDKRRGVIRGFSHAARMRMLREVARIDWPAVGKSLFVTLTYPDDKLEPSFRERSQDRYLFLRYVEKHLQRHVPTVWRSEWKRRRSGRYKNHPVPHFHLLVCGVPWLAWQDVRQWWRNVLHASGPLATDVRGIEGTDGPARYIAKYLAKPDSLDRIAYVNNAWTCGKQWDITRTAELPRRPVEVFRQLDGLEIEFAKQEAVKRYANYDSVLGGGFTLFGEETKAAFLRELGNSC